MTELSEKIQMLKRWVDGDQTTTLVEQLLEIYDSCEPYSRYDPDSDPRHRRLSVDPDQALIDVTQLLIDRLLDLERCVPRSTWLKDLLTNLSNVENLPYDLDAACDNIVDRWLNGGA